MAMTPEEFVRRGGRADPAGLTDEELRFITAPTKKDPDNAMAKVNAYGTGASRGIAGLLGMGVDTVMNVADLAKAGAGTAYHAATGKPIPAALEVGSREDIPMSSEWILKKARHNNLTKQMVDPIDPYYEGGLLQAAGSGTSGFINPATRGQAARQVGTNVLSSTIAKLVGDATGSTEAAIAAGAASGRAPHMVREGGRRAVQGGRSAAEIRGRSNVLSDAGIDEPTLGLLTGNRALSGIENQLFTMPGGSGRMQAARDRGVAGIEGNVGRTANLASTNRGAAATGTAIQQGVRDFRQDFNARQRQLYGNLEDAMGGGYPVDISNYRRVLNNNTPVPDAPETSRLLLNSRLTALRDALRSDTAGTPPTYRDVPADTMTNRPAQMVMVDPGTPDTNTLPFRTVRGVRTSIGEQRADNPILSGATRRHWDPAYAALSDDIRGAANEAGASQEFNRANTHSRGGMNRLEQVTPFTQDRTPEKTYEAVAATAHDQGSLFNQIKKTLPPGARGQIAGTVIEKMGRATSGNQNAAGDVFSPETFLTNWDKLNKTPGGVDRLLSGFPNAGQVRADLQKAADAAAMMRDHGKSWSNPSGTAQASDMRALMGKFGIGGAGFGLGAVTGGMSAAIPLGIASAGLGMGGANLASRAVTGAGGREFAMTDGRVYQPSLQDLNQVYNNVQRERMRKGK